MLWKIKGSDKVAGAGSVLNRVHLKCATLQVKSFFMHAFLDACVSEVHT